MSYVERVARGIYWMWIGFGVAAIINWAFPIWKTAPTRRAAVQGFGFSQMPGQGASIFKEVSLWE